MKRSVSVILVLMLVLASLVTGCSKKEDTAKAEERQVYKMSLSWLAAEKTAMIDSAKYFKDLVEKKTDGQVLVTIYHSQQIATSDRENAEKTQQNIIQMTSVPSYTVAEFSKIREFNVTDLPFIATKNEQLDALFESDVMAPYLQQFTEKTGIMTAGSFCNGWSKVGTTKKAFKFPKDIAGVKIRTQASDVYINTVKSWGAAPTPMAFGEVFTALQQGTVEGMIGATQMIYDEKFYEPLKYMVDVNAFPNYHIVLLNKSWVDSLPANLRPIVLDCVKEYVVHSRGHIGTVDEEMFLNCEKGGVTITHLTDEERKVWSDAAKPAYDTAKESIGPEFVGKVEAFVTNFSK